MFIFHHKVILFTKVFPLDADEYNIRKVGEVMITKEKDNNGRQFTKWDLKEKTYALEVELDSLLTSRPTKPLKIYVKNELVFDSVDYFYSLPLVRCPIGAKSFIDN